MGRFGSPEALEELGRTGARAGSVELKALLVPPAGPVAEALTGRCAPTWSERRMYLFDTAGLDLLRAGVEVRLRRRARGRWDLAVSVRRRGDAHERMAPRGTRVELDVVPGAAWQDIEVRREVDAAAATAVLEGTAPARDLLSAPQRSWAGRGGTEPVEDMRLRELIVFGPLVVNRVKVAGTAVGLRRADLEHFCFPSGRELVEVSTRCGLQEVSSTASAFDRLLDERAVEVLPDYLPKTAVWHDEIVEAGGR